jgi:transcriptional regulator with XRE-family HTH domain
MLFCVCDAQYMHKQVNCQLQNDQTCISERLKAVLEEQGLSIKAFAQRTDLPYRTAQSYLNGERSPNVEGLTKLATRMCINITWLLTGEGHRYWNEDVAEEGQFIEGRSNDRADALPKERIKQWLDFFWAQADEKEKAWLEIEFQRRFPEYKEWLMQSDS